MGAVALAVAVSVLLPLRSRLDRTTDALVLLIPGVLAALVGGRRAAVVVSVAAGLAFNIGFLRPYGTLKVDVADEVIDLIAFVGVGLGAATLVGREADRRREAEAATEEIRALDRENLIGQLREHGVPVVAWAGAGSLDQVLRDVSRVASGPRAFAR